MKLIVGLGNPGPKYETTKHNVGFLAVDQIAEKWKATDVQNRFDSEVFQLGFQGERVVLAKPQTFMNLSGRSVSALFNFYKLNPQDLIVIHDDLDLEKFSVRIKIGGGTGGHRGLRSIDESLGVNKNGYLRIRIGIGRPDRNARDDVSDYVLDRFDDNETPVLERTFEKVTEIAALLIENRVLEAMNRFHGPEGEQ